MTIDMQAWLRLPQETRDRAYNSAAAVTNSPAITADWAARSAVLRARHAQTLDLPYGPRPRNRVDFFDAGAGGPTLVFIHGGFWQIRAKEEFAFCAAGPMTHGVNVAMVGYTLAPEATLDDMAAEIRSSLDYLSHALPDMGADPDRVYLSGWSAGAQLAAMALDHPIVKGGLCISGIYDLEPIRHIYANEVLRLDEGMASRNSPAKLAPRGNVPLLISAGAAELPELRRQSADFARHCEDHGMAVHYEEMPGADHFTVMDPLADPQGRLTTLLLRMIGL